MHTFLIVFVFNISFLIANTFSRTNVVQPAFGS